jgi:hypothetical protein
MQYFLKLLRRHQSGHALPINQFAYNTYMFFVREHTEFCYTTVLARISHDRNRNDRAIDFGPGACTLEGLRLS